MLSESLLLLQKGDETSKLIGNSTVTEPMNAKTKVKINAHLFSIVKIVVLGKFLQI